MKSFNIIRSFTRAQEQTIEAETQDEAMAIAEDNPENWENISNVNMEDWNYEIEEVK